MWVRKRVLLARGYPETLLDRAYHDRGQRFAFKMNPLKKNSPILFEVEGFEKWVQKQCTVK